MRVGREHLPTAQAPEVDEDGFEQRFVRISRSSSGSRIAFIEKLQESHTSWVPRSVLVLLSDPNQVQSEVHMELLHPGQAKERI